MSKELEKWNEKAKIQNTKMFIKEFGRNPINYDEVLTWIKNMFNTHEENTISVLINGMIIKINGKITTKIVGNKIIRTFE